MARERGRAHAKSSDTRLTCSDAGVERLRSGADSGPSASRDRPPSRSDLGLSQVLTMQVKGTAAAQQARPRPLAAITAGQAAPI